MGKTQFPDALYIDLLNTGTSNNLLTQPTRLEKMISLHKHLPIIIDEVQRVPDLLIGIHLPAFTKRAKRRIVQHPKFYLFDVGVVDHQFN